MTSELHTLKLEAGTVGQLLRDGTGTCLGYLGWESRVESLRR